MHRCGSHGNACSCGLFQSTQPGSSFSILFAPLPHKNETADVEDPSSSLVDCTLSLGTPSTRQTEAFNYHQYPRPSSSPCTSSFCWDILQSKQPTISTSHGSKSGGGASSGVLNMGSDTRRCANCDTTSTPLWRNGPRGPKSLCNACGIRYKKEERRATTSALESPNQHYSNSYHNHHQQWGYSAQPQLQATTISPASAFNNSEFRLIQDDDDDGDSSRFLSWRLSVPSPHDFPVHMT